MDDHEPTVRDEGTGAGAMRKRRTTLEDGRYLIYYTFGDAGQSPREGSTGAREREAPGAEPLAGEEEIV